MDLKQAQRLFGSNVALVIQTIGFPGYLLLIAERKTDVPGSTELIAPFFRLRQVDPDKPDAKIELSPLINKVFGDFQVHQIDTGYCVAFPAMQDRVMLVTVSAQKVVPYGKFNGNWRKLDHVEIYLKLPNVDHVQIVYKHGDPERVDIPTAMQNAWRKRLLLT